MPTEARQIRPPETTEKEGEAIAATLPDSTSPRRGPPATTRLKTEFTRPRIRSGVSTCIIVERQTALTESAAPARAKNAAAGQMLLTKPAAAMKRPQKATATSTIRPSRRAWEIQPVVS